MKTIISDRKICCDDVIKDIYDLNKLDIKVYKTLCKETELRTTQIAEQLKKERSTVYRSLQRLYCCGLCVKKTKTIPKGGYYHVYKAVEKKETKKNLEKCIEEWSEKMKKTLNEL